ncbi:MAG: MFS transporter [Burkholderiales bacterium]
MPATRAFTRFKPVLQPGEFPALAWSFTYFFCLLCAYYVLRPVREEMGIQGGVNNLKYLFSATFVSMLAVVPLFGWASARWPRARLLPIVYAFFISHIIGFYFLFTLQVNPPLTAQVFFVWLSVFNVFVVSVFWSFMSDIFRNDQARRLYGVIAAGGSLGAISGPTLTAVLVAHIGVANLLLLACLFLALALVCIVKLNRWALRAPRHSAAEQRGDALGGSLLAGIRLAFTSRYLLGICAYILLLSALGTFLYLEQMRIISATIASPVERTQLFARVDMGVNVLTLFVQFFVTAQLVLRFGVTFCLMLMPLLSFGAFGAVALVPTLAVIIALGMLRRVMEYAITRPSREVLFTVVSREERYKAKNVIDTVVIRGGDAMSSWMSDAVKSLGASTSHIALLAMPLAAVWAVLAYWLGRRQEQMAREAPANEETPHENRSS